MAQLIFNLIIIVVLSIALLISMGWPRETALFPQAVGLPILSLSIITFILGLYKNLREKSRNGMGVATGFKFPAKASAVLGWLVAFGAGIWIFGFYIAAFLFVVFYMKIESGISWVLCLIYSIATTGIFFVLFDLILNVRLSRGILLAMIGS